jgi:hypothetical protein
MTKRTAPLTPSEAYRGHMIKRLRGEGAESYSVQRDGQHLSYAASREAGEAIVNMLLD